MSTINLLPEDYLQGRAQRRANMLCVILFGVVMAGIGGAALVSAENTRNTRQVRDQVDASYAKAADLLMQMQELQAQKRTMIRKAKATAVLLERVPRSYVLAVLAEALPENASLVHFALEPKRKPSAAAPAPAGDKSSTFAKAKAQQQQQTDPQELVVAVEVVGLAATDVEVATFITNLLRNPMLTSVELSYSQEKVLRAVQKGQEDLRVREFKVTMELRPGVDVIDLAAEAGPEPAAKAGQTVEGAKS